MSIVLIYYGYINQVTKVLTWNIEKKIIKKGLNIFFGC
jgi:hypothetical protein